jgi:hypothetical protein
VATCLGKCLFYLIRDYLSWLFLILLSLRFKFLVFLAFLFAFDLAKVLTLIVGNHFCLFDLFRDRLLDNRLGYLSFRIWGFLYFILNQKTVLSHSSLSFTFSLRHRWRCGINFLKSFEEFAVVLKICQLVLLGDQSRLIK